MNTSPCPFFHKIVWIRRIASAPYFSRNRTMKLGSTEFTNASIPRNFRHSSLFSLSVTK